MIALHIRRTFMPTDLNRRKFIRQSLLTSSVGALAIQLNPTHAQAESSVKLNSTSPSAPNSMAMGKIGKLEVSRLLLGGNLLTHFTHSRDLKYVYRLAEHYNTEAKILETLALAEKNGINTLVIHTVPWALDILKKHRTEWGGRMQWIICTTADVNDTLDAYKQSVQETVEMGADAIYLWGVRADQLVAQNRIDSIAKAVEYAKTLGVPSGVGAHDSQVIVECEKNKIEADFYLKTFHHHRYPSAPRPDELTQVMTDHPGYWCKDPERVIEVMKTVEKPWIAFKVMAAGAIPPQDAFAYAYQNGADHIVAGMFDFEIEADVKIATDVLSSIQRARNWWS